jgi:hypothetical protein
LISERMKRRDDVFFFHVRFLSVCFWVYITAAASAMRIRPP